MRHALCSCITRVVTAVVILLWLTPGRVGAVEPPSPPYGMHLEHTWIPMKDGVRLAANLFMPTGGVDATKENLAAWFKAGVCAVGIGSKLISQKLMEQKDYNSIEKLTREVLQTVQFIKNSS